VRRSETGTKRKPAEVEYFERVKSRKLANIQPSQLNDYNVYADLQKDPDEKIFDDSPDLDVDIPPLPLLYRGFGHFLDSTNLEAIQFIQSGRLSNRDSTKDEDVDRLMQTMCRIYSEGVKRDRVQDLLHRILFSGGAPFEYNTNNTSQRATDGHILAAHGGPLFIFKYKPQMDVTEPQLGGNFIQLAEAAIAQIFRGWRQPCLGLIIRGKSDALLHFSAGAADLRVVPGEYISFHGLVMVDAQVRMLPLTPAFSCKDSAFESRAPLYAAFSAAKDLLKNIEKDAKEFVESSAQENQNAILHSFPNIQSLCRFPSDGQQEQRINFRITESFGGGIQGRSL
jgi:hypothetical protein